MSFVHRVADLVEQQGNALTGKADHWERVPLGSVAKVINGFPFASSGFNTEEGEPVIRIRDVTSGTVGTLFRGDASEAPRAEYGDLVIGMDGDFNSRLWPGQSALINQRVCKVVPNEAHYSKAFLAYVIPGYLKLVNDHTSAITVKHLSSGTVNDLPLPLPPRNEQDRLVSKLDELFSRIDEGERALERVATLVEHYRQSVLKAAVTGELTRDWREKNKDQLESGEALLARILKARRESWEKAELDKMKAKGITPANDKWKQKYEEPAAPHTSGLPSLPEGWVWSSLPMLCQEDSTSGISVKGSDFPPGVPALRLDAMKEKGFDYSARRYIPISDGVANKLAIRRGDFFISRANGSIRFVGRGVLAPSPPERIVFPDTMIRYRLADAPDTREWLMAIWPSRLIRAQIEAKAKTTAGIYKISQQDIANFAIPLPPLDEQSEAASRLDQAITRAAYLRDDMQASLKKSSRQRQAILMSAFAGSLVPQHADDEPASVLLERIAAERNDEPAQSKRGRKSKTSQPA